MKICVAADAKIGSENSVAVDAEIGSDSGVVWTFIFFLEFTFSLS